MAEDTKAKISLITPPDILHNLHTSFFLVYPSTDTKHQFQNLIDTVAEDLNVYLYENEDTESQFDWLLNVMHKCNYVILDVDNFPPMHKQIISYLIAHNNVYWLTKGENEVYNTLSKNRIYNLDWLCEFINGGYFEKQT